MDYSKYYNRRTFIRSSALLVGFAGFFRSASATARNREVMTVTGPMAASLMHNTLPHEHILVDFIGAEEINPPRWDRELVIEKILPYLEETKLAGCHTFIDCTPNYLGRDVVLLKQLSQKSGLYILTNTGYYGGFDHKFLPPETFVESAGQLARRWTTEWQEGIDGTGVRPGFIKISVNASTLSDISRKLIQAAAITHLKTGLTIASHTGPAVPAFEQIEILKSTKVSPAAFIWVHAQNEREWDNFVKATQAGAWVSLDGLNEENVTDYVAMLSYLKKEKCLEKILVSHDAGWYDPSKSDGGEIRGYSVLFRKLIPALEQAGFAEQEIEQIIQKNPMNAFATGIKKWNWKKKREN
jgi:phosphotriesterase-related protein